MAEDDYIWASIIGLRRDVMSFAVEVMTRESMKSCDSATVFAMVTIL